MGKEKVVNKEVVITTVDLGNMNIKYIGRERGMFSAKISNDIQSYEEGFQRIELDGRITYIGIGELSREFSKAEREYKTQLLYAICKANSNQESIETNLTLLLPALQMPNKKKMVDDLKGKEFNFKFNGKDRKVLINDLAVLPEGYVSYFDLTEEEKKEDLCIIDCGSRTMNICCIIEGKIEKMNTVKLGSLDFFSKIKSIEAAKGKDYVEEDIERLIKRGNIKVSEGQYESFFKEMLNSIKSYVNIDNYTTIFTGGTSVIVKKYIECSGYKIHGEPLYSNINGAVKASNIIWSNRNV